MCIRRRSRQRGVGRGLVLLELLTVVGIIAILIALLIPMFLKAQERAARYRCQEQLRQIGQALLHYSRENKGRFPTTQSSSYDITPDLSNSGWRSPDPFSPGGPTPNNVPAAIFLLVRMKYVSPEALICPGTRGVPEKLGNLSPALRSNFSNVRQNLSYSMQNPYATSSAIESGFRWDRRADPDFVIMGDRNPGTEGEGDNVLAVGPSSPWRQMRLGNSNNHEKAGQNVLYADGRAAFVPTPFAGVEGDNIYCTKDGVVVGPPVDKGDTILLPTDD